MAVTCIKDSCGTRSREKGTSWSLEWGNEIDTLRIKEEEEVEGRRGGRRKRRHHVSVMSSRLR